ncbi:MFS transporter, partial [Stella sp.]|uniref:MFS transporter n=1 Tax=Stella sp. TaxID=2912054 RepID=UPI0035B04DFF
IFVASTIMPSVVAEIGGLAYYAWNATLFIVGSIVGSALASDLLGRRGAHGAYRLAAAAFAAGSLLAALAPSMPVLLAARALQGLGGGLLFALSYAVIRLVLPQPLWPRAIALVSGTWGVAALSGPFVGGIFAELGQWRLAFWAVLAATGAFYALCTRVLPAPSAAPPAGPAGRFPSRRLALLAGAALAISGASVVPSLWINAAGIAVAGLLLLAMVRLERAASVRLLPSDALRPATPLGAVYLTMALITVGTNAIVFVPLLLQVLHGRSPLGAGYLTVLQALGWTLGSLLSAGSAPRRAMRAMVLGPAAMATGLALLAWRMPLPSGDEPLAIAGIGLLLGMVGLGVGFAWPHLLTRAMTVASEAERSLASSSISTVQLVTSAFASALAGVVANLGGIIEPGGAAGAASAAFWLFATFTLGPFAAAAAAAALILPGLRSAGTGASTRPPGRARD